MSVAVSHDTREIEITPPRRLAGLSLRELWNARELLYFLTKRELQIRYKQSLLGISWAVVQPLALAFLFALFFGRLAKVPSDGVPYPVFALAGLGVWLFANQAVTQAAQSLVGDANLVSKVYFPRLVVPLGKVLALLVDVVLSTVVTLLFVAIYGLGLRATALLAPIFLLLALIVAVGAGSLLAALNVRYRDVGVAVPLLAQLWLFATPVLYPGSLVTGGWQYLYAVNPLVSAVQGMRWALLGTPGPALIAVAISVVSASLVLGVGLVYFKATESTFADLI